ncbi:MAG: hypothetical protein K2P28_11930 [Lachnospiraceae bacterium]|nr:hypothetical protein [Lachnospiraceae bacterium]
MRVATDIGGTFTDLVAVDDKGGTEGPMGIVARKVMNRDDTVRMVTCTEGGRSDDPLKDRAARWARLCF